jgi:hypothetical protein
MSIIKMKTHGLIISLDGNIGFTLPSNMGELDNIGLGPKLDLSNCSLTGIYSYVDIKSKRTSTMAWLDFCMFWLGFVYPRSHSGWIGPIGEFEGAAFIRKQDYRYSIPLFPDLPSILRHRLAFLSDIVPVRWRDLIFVCFDWVLYTPGPIPAELGQLANLQVLRLEINKLTGNHPFLPLACIQYVGKGLLSFSLFIPVG